MSNQEAPTRVLEDQEHDQQAAAALPEAAYDDQKDKTGVDPNKQARYDREFAGIVEKLKPKLSEDSRGRLGRIAITDEDGYVPHGETKTEARWRRENPFVGWPFFKQFSPGHHKHQFMVNAVRPKVAGALDGREKGYLYGDHDATVNNTAAVIRSLDIKLHANQYHVADPTTYHSKIDHTGQRRTGYATNQFRRPIARINQALGRMRSPESQVTDEAKIALREIGKLHNLDLHMADADASDKNGLLGDALRSGRPATIRHELKVLSDKGVISEHNPLHARWSEAMDPKNVKAFRQYLIRTSDEKVHGITPASATLYITAAGIMGDMRPRAVADYLGVTYEEWHEQRTGFLVEKGNPIESNQHHKVPKEVVDQICLLMKLDSRIVEYVTVKDENGKDKTVPRTALDVLIEVGAARPMTDPSRSSDPESPLSKSPMERVEDKNTEVARLALEEQDRNDEQIRLLSMQYGANLEEINRRLAGLDPENEEDSEEFETLSKQKAKLIARLKSHGVPVPDEQDKVSDKK